MGAPVLIGAGIGAATSLAMGRSPLQGALLGGIGGGAFGGSGGFGSGFTEGGLFGSGGLFESALPAATEGVKSGVQLGVNPSLGAEGSLLDVGGSLSTDLNPIVSSSEGLSPFGQGAYLDYTTGSPIIGSYGDPVGVNLSKGFTPFAGNVSTKGVQLDVMPLPENVMDLSATDLLSPENVSSLGAPVSSGMPTPSFMDKAYDKFSSYIRENPSQLLQSGLIAGSLMDDGSQDMQVQGSGGGDIKRGDPSLVKGYEAGSGLNLGYDKDIIAGKVAMTTVPRKKRKYSIG